MFHWIEPYLFSILSINVISRCHNQITVDYLCFLCNKQSSNLNAWVFLRTDINFRETVSPPIGVYVKFEIYYLDTGMDGDGRSFSGERIRIYFMKRKMAWQTRLPHAWKMQFSVLPASGSVGDALEAFKRSLQGGKRSSRFLVRFSERREIQPSGVVFACERQPKEKIYT